MRRSDIQLLAQARRGDVAARCEVGRLYLMGGEGFPRHVPTGIGYLTHPSVHPLPQAAMIIAQSLPLHEILAHGLESSLARAAGHGSLQAQARLGAWLCLRDGASGEGRRWLETAAASGHGGARTMLDALRATGDAQGDALLRALARWDDADVLGVALHAARRALEQRHFHRAVCGLSSVLALAPRVSAEIAELVAQTVVAVEDNGCPLQGLDVRHVEAALEERAGRGNGRAAYTLGRALCGITCGAIDAASLVAGPNLRKGAALLLRAADTGIDKAWLHLYRLHSAHRSSVANPQMARFFLEKAAASGHTEAQRKLGALVLKASVSIDETELAIHWLSEAMAKGDAHARKLLASLVLPLRGADEDAGAAVEEVRRSDPWLAARMQLARDFGLTKLEALSVNPAEGLRAWGLVVGRNPFVSQARLAAPRAVPALSAAVMERLRGTATLFTQAHADTRIIEGDLRKRSVRQRRAFERHRIDEAMFFASASATLLETLRQGPKWAFRQRRSLQQALAA